MRFFFGRIRKCSHLNMWNVEYGIRNNHHAFEENKKQVYFPVKFARVSIKNVQYFENDQNE